ncbi:unnamed protein product [Dovyalis caffra]|uniref:DUF4219 domain-containing protein n=1 Tax=Dovyalis caffra TaxID=77055 RepID=A0AAV1RQX4_9ROSI|nr:unnamed protein product [Dovyalis caffra]
MASAIVPEILGKDNYDDWSVCMKNYLLAQDLWDIIKGPNSTEPPDQAVSVAEFNAWMKKNATALHAIQISCRPDIYSEIRKAGSAETAKTAWDTLLKNSFRNPFVFETEGLVDSEYTGAPELVEYITGGDWHSVESFLGDHPDVINEKITSTGDTALHVATLAGKVEIVRKLVESMSREALAIQDVDGRTPLHHAATKGITTMARYMVEKNENLVAITDNWRLIPVILACGSARRDMTVYLLSKTPSHLLSEENGSALLQCAIASKMFGKSVALPH